MIRTLTQNDLEKLAALRTNPEASESQRKTVQIAFSQLFPRLFFDGPWQHPELQSLVSEDGAGNPDGMISVKALPMLFQEQEITAAIGADLYVAPEARAKMTGFTLLKQFLNGPQDIAICDIANGTTRRIWERMGGFVAPLYNMNWIGVLRPMQLAGCILREKKYLGPVGSVVKTAAPLFDRVLADRFGCEIPDEDGSLTSHTLSPTEFSDHFAEFTREEALRPIYSRHAAEWTWQRLPFLSPGDGEVSTVAVRNRRGALLGWYIWKLEQGGVATVLQIAARQSNAGFVLDHMIRRAHSEGAAAVAGRLQPRFLQLLLDRGFQLRARSTCMLVHSRNAELLNCFRHGTAWLSALDGEAPSNVWNSPQRAADAMKAVPRGLPADSDTQWQQRQPCGTA